MPVHPVPPRRFDPVRPAWLGGATTPLDAYYQGWQARADRPAATTWEGALPYSGGGLVHAWLDGWRDAAGDFTYRRRGPQPQLVPYADVIGVVGGVCPFCWALTGMTDLPDGTLRCIRHPCRDSHWPPVDPAAARAFLAARDAGAFI
jgi:hypothetical protein